MVTTSRPASVGYAEAVLSGPLLGLAVLPLIALRLTLWRAGLLRDPTDALIACLYYPVFRVWAGYGGFGI
jgi:hypothetical protein